MRPILRPGSHVLRRDSAEFQIGLDPRSAVILPADEEIRGCLKRLATSADESQFTGNRDAETLGLLAANDLLLDGDRLRPLMPTQQRTPPATRSRRKQTTVSRFDVAAVAREDGDDASRLLERRAGSRVRLGTFGDAAGEAPAADLQRLVVRAGLCVADEDATARSSDIGVLVGVGEPRRERADSWVRDGTPHILVRLTEGHALVGPFVLPGKTACLRCIDAHHTDADSSWPLLIEQYARLTGLDRADGIPEPVDTLLASVAVAWAARDLASYAEGRRPSCWSATIRFDAHLATVESRPWLRHPACGCGWG